MIKAITFDFWSTLYRPRSIDFSQRLLKLKETIERTSGQIFELEQVRSAVTVARDTWSLTWTEAHRTMGADEWLSIILKELNLSIPADHLFEIQSEMEHSVLNELPSLVPEAKETLAELSAGYRLAIISDTGITPGRVLRQILAKDEVIDYFTHLTFSDEVGRSKPHPEAFLATLQALHVSAAEAVHVGDLLRTDIAGAQGVGMRGVQYIGVSQDDWSVSSDIIVEPDAIIQNHRELMPLLAQWVYGNGR